MNQDYKRRIEEREIDLMDLIYYISMHWRSILVAALVGMIALGIFSAVTSKQGVEKAKLATIESMKSDLLKEYEEDGTYDTKQKREDRLALVETVAEQIKAYDVLIDAQNQYLNGSVFARENVTNVSCRNLQYLITVDGNSATYLNSLVDAYSGVIQSDAVFEKVADKTGREVEKQFVGECILIEKVAADNLIDTADTNVNVYSNGVNSENDKSEDSLQNKVSTVLNVVVMGPSDEFAETLAKVVTEAVDNSAAGLNESVIAHDIVLAGDNAFTKYTNEFATKKSDAVGVIKAKEDDKVKLKSSLSENEEFYAEMIVDEVRIKENEKEPQQGVLISKKIIAIGFIGGAVVLLCLWAVVYLLSENLMCSSMLESLSGVRAYSINTQDEKKFFLDRWVKEWFDKTADIPLETVAELMAVDVKKTEIKKLAIVGVTAVEVAEKLLEQFKKNLPGVDIILCSDVVNNPKMKEEVASVDGVVIVENVKKAKAGFVVNEMAEVKCVVGCVGVR